MLKIAKEKSKLVKFLNEKLKISVGFERLLFFFMLFLVDDLINDVYEGVLIKFIFF